MGVRPSFFTSGPFARLEFNLRLLQLGTASFRMSSPPTTLGQYQIIREIARSNDIVYEAYDPLMNRRVAIKELSMPAGATSPQKDERVSRFRREAQAAGTLNHPNIMTVFTFAEDAGRTFMAMEYLDGCSLRNELDTKGFLPVPRAIEIAMEVLQGLEHAHAKGVIHRDIKPDNVQILSNGSIKITDFGIARLTFQPNLTMDGQVFGTPSYMSPEQVVGKDIDARSDLFSLGVMLYEMISGQKPFAGDSVVSITYAIMNKEPQQPSQADWALWSVISKALEKTPSMRYGSAAEMLKALQGVLNPVSPLAPDPSPSMPYATTGVAIPPIVPPAYGGGAPVLNQPYNPYASQPAPQAVPGVYTQPYATTGATYVPPGAGNYGYNPYQPSPSAIPGAPGGQQFPVYYPPPPRTPLLKPDQLVFVKRFFLFLLLGGLLVILLVVALSSWSNLNAAAKNRDHDAQINPIYTSVDKNLTIDENISRLQTGLSQALDPSTRAAISAKVSDLQQQKANGYVAVHDGPHAEVYFQNAGDSDSGNASAKFDYGKALYERALSQTDAVEKQTLFKQAAKLLADAASAATNRNLSSQYSQDAAQAYYMYALTTRSVAPEQRGDIRSALITARDNADPNTDLGHQIQQLLADYN
jgi:serine/threonine-protein kinase